MIITRTPLRISIGGGGTDLPSYYSKHGGFFISAAISQYIYIALHRIFRPTYLVKYSKLEEVDALDQIQHPIVREAYRLHGIGPGIEMTSQADIPAGTGLGSSGAFNVGLLRALSAWKREHVATHALAEEACHIEMDILGEPIGKQDQFIASFGGMTCFDIDRAGKVTVTPLRMSNATLHDLEENLLLFFTGYSRSASAVLSDQKKRSEKEDPHMIENLHFVKELGLGIKKQLEAGDTEAFAAAMHRHWLKKKERSTGISNDKINDWYELALKNGAMGGKLIGAGGGGFLMFYAKDRAMLRQAMAQAGLTEVRFAFDFEGSKVIVNER